jgi:hypothetical protein
MAIMAVLQFPVRPCLLAAMLSAPDCTVHVPWCRIDGRQRGSRAGRVGGARQAPWERSLGGGRPPSESSRMRVSFESRYGMCWRPRASVSADMTFPSAESDALIFLLCSAHNTTCCNTARRAAAQHNVLQHCATCCNTTQRVVTQRDVLQHTTACCSRTQQSLSAKGRAQSLSGRGVSPSPVADVAWVSPLVPVQMWQGVTSSRR